MKQQIVFSLPQLSLCSTQSSPSKDQSAILLLSNDKDELNDSIEMFMNESPCSTEISVLKYLSALRIQTKTDPRQKEHAYWIQQRVEANRLIQQNEELTLNCSINRILQKRLQKQSQTCTEFDIPV
ncbi:hypothetical protein pb186bvf_009681 [Paramecium bursaria]